MEDKFFIYKRFPETEFTAKNCHDFNNYRKNIIGNTNNLLQTNYYVTKDQVYGKKLRRLDQSLQDVLHCKIEFIY